jgi:hypothetical protein
MEYLMDKWNERTKSRVKLSTYTSYLCIAENYILPEFGGYYTSELTNLCIADFLQKEKQNGYAFGTIHLIAVVLRSILHFGSEMKALFSEELHVNFQK